MSNKTKNYSQVVAFDLEGTLTSGRIANGMINYLEKYQNANPKSLTSSHLLDILFLFKGFSVEQFRHMAEWAVHNEILPKLREKVNQELFEHKSKGRHVIIVSAMFEPVLSIVASMLDVDYVGTPLLFDNNIFTGKIKSEMNIGTYKVEALLPFMINGKVFAAYGDTVADIPMLEISENPTAVNPDGELLAKAKLHNWRILTDN
jgi:HAD superfamily phosphoserine phosphatase-like hydrolase